MVDELVEPEAKPNDPFALDHPLRPVVQAWLREAKRSQEQKKEEFGNWAEQCMDFYRGDGKAIWGKYMLGEKGVVREAELDSTFRFSSNRGAELVQIIGPHLYNRNPVRTVNPRRLPKVSPDLFGDPQDQRVQQFTQQLNQQQAQRESLAKHRAEWINNYLNYTPSETGFKETNIRMVVEALVKGVGCAWTDIKEWGDTGQRLVTSEYESVDHFLPDPDEELLDRGKWIMKVCDEPIWKLAEEYGQDVELLLKFVKGVHSSGDDEITHGDGRDEPKAGTNDRVTYYKVWSRMGMGDRLSDVRQDYGEYLGEFGDYVYLVIVPGLPYPLNLSTEDFWDFVTEDEDEEDPLIAQEAEERREDIFMQVQWPVPFYLDNRWPVTFTAFHEIPNEKWAMAHLRPAVGQIKFMNWGMSFLAERVRHNGRIVVGSKKHLDEDQKEVIRRGGPVEYIDFADADGRTLKEMFEVFQFPSGNKDIWEVMQAANVDFEKLTGLSDIMRGEPGGMRSATEAQGKYEAANIRPDDMADRVEDANREMARKEALAAIWAHEPDEMRLPLGPAAPQVWDYLFGDIDPQEVALELDFNIESGSARRPNKQARIAQMNEALQVMLPIFTQLVAQTGNVEPINQLLRQWAKAMDIEPELMMIPPPPQQQDPAAQAEAQKAQMEARKQQMEMQLQQQKAQIEQRKADLEARLKIIDARMKNFEAQSKQQQEVMELQAEREKIQMELAKQEAEMRQAEERHLMEMRAKAEEFGQKLAFDEAKMRQEQKRIKKATDQGGKK